MGQYHLIANYDKKQFIKAHAFGEGIKLMEFGRGGDTMTALAVLLAASCTPTERGGGDIHPWCGGPGYETRIVPGLTKERGEWLMENVVGSWAGDRIAIIGDYAEDEDAKGLVGREGSPWVDGGTGWTNISALALEAIEMDYYTWSTRQPSKRAAD